MRDKLQENEKLMKEMSLTWEEKLTKTGQTQEDRRQALEKLGISVQSSGIKVEKNKCYLVNLNRCEYFSNLKKRIQKAQKFLTCLLTKCAKYQVYQITHRYKYFWLGNTFRFWQ